MESTEQIQEHLFKLLGEIAPEIDPAQINPDETLRDQVDIDSIDFLKFITRIYETLGINIPESDYQKLRTFNDIVSYVETKKK
jgi:acyl carrier protein